MELLFSYLNSLHPLSGALVTYLRENLQEKHIAKKGLLLKAGHVCRSICFVEKGLLRCFYVQGASEVCSWFMKEGDVIISVESFFQQRESYESIQAIEDCRLFCLSYRELQYLYKEVQEFNVIGRILTEKYYMLSEQRLYSLRMQRAQERYEHLLTHHPDLLLRVPAKYIASYLGISEAHFSVIKGRQ